jgi:Tfp pilus assembly protein PilX
MKQFAQDRPLDRQPALKPASQRGAVLLFCLIALTIMLIGAAGLVRSFQSTLFSAGNIGFKRDMRNESEMALNLALGPTGYFRTGLLSSSTARSGNLPLANYSAVMLPTNAQGVPDVFSLSDAAFAAAFSVPDATSPDGSVRVRFVIDRLCNSSGDESTLAAASCILASTPAAPGSGGLNLQSAERAGLTTTTVAAVPQSVVYRITARVIGPRNTMSFFQSTVTVPSS